MNLNTNYVTVTHVTADNLAQRLRKVKKVIKPVNIDHLDTTASVRQIINTVGQQHNDGLRGLFDGQRKHIQGKDSKGRAFIITFHGEQDETYRYELILVDAFDLKTPEELNANRKLAVKYGLHGKDARDRALGLNQQDSEALAEAALLQAGHEKVPYVASPMAGSPSIAQVISEPSEFQYLQTGQDVQVFSKAVADNLGTRTFDFSGEQANTHWHALATILKNSAAQEPQNIVHILVQGLKDAGLEAYVEKALLYYGDKAGAEIFGTGDIMVATVELVQFLYNEDHNSEEDNGATVPDSAYQLVSTKYPNAVAPAAPVAPPVTDLPIPQETTMNQVTLTKAPRCDIIIPEVTELVLVNLEPFGLSEHEDLVETYYRAALQAPNQEQAKMEIDALCNEFMDIGYENIDPFRFESYAMLQAVGKVLGEKPANHPDTTHEAVAVEDRAIQGRTDVLDFFDMRKALFLERYWSLGRNKPKNNPEKFQIPAAIRERFPTLDLSKDEQRVALMHHYAAEVYSGEGGFDAACTYAGTDDAGHKYHISNGIQDVQLVVIWGNRITDYTLVRKQA